MNQIYQDLKVVMIHGSKDKSVPVIYSRKMLKIFKTNKIKKVSFGSRGMDQYYDKIGYYFANDHLNKERRKRYYSRFGRKAEKYSPLWFSNNFLW